MGTGEGLSVMGIGKGLSVMGTSEGLSVMGIGEGLSAMRILTSRDRNIRRIGSFQSCISIPSAEVNCVAVTVSDSDGRDQIGECGG
jgi:hypothetical protein